MKNNTIVSLADSNYFDLLNELVDSILKFSESKEVDICILDAGLSIEQKNILSKKVKEIKKAQWDIDVPGYKVGEKEWLKSQVSRAFLPRYFPNLVSIPINASKSSFSTKKFSSISLISFFSLLYKSNPFFTFSLFDLFLMYVYVSS